MLTTLVCGLYLQPAASHAKPLCTAVLDVQMGRMIVEDGACDRRVTPASTFKIALAVMGYDAGFLIDESSPALPYKPGDPAWGGAAWKRTITPTLWMKDSVVWYSQRITRQLGSPRLRGYADAFGYGNADFAGDAGRDNGLERAWIGSSLAISPREQVTFLQRLVDRALPATPEAQRKAMALVEARQLDSGWMVRGKTGMAYPRRADGEFDRSRAFGWYVGWAEKGGRLLVFAHLIQDETALATPAGYRARDTFLRDLPRLAAEPVSAEPPRMPQAQREEKPWQQDRPWREEKCLRYTQAWTDLLARTGKAGLGTAFITRHDAFIASGCTSGADVCPQSPREFEAANLLTIRAMNAGMASTFLPFSCKGQTAPG